MLLPQELETEIATLATRYGPPARVSVTLPDAGFDPLMKNDRIGEVCMVVRRPNDRLLTARKTFYPPGAYRLLTGGIAPGEAIEAALLREVWEETGLEVAVRRFLALIAYHAPSSDRPLFYTFAFLLDAIGGTLAPQDASERLEDFQEVLPEELPAVAGFLEQVPATYDPEIGGSWRNWGIFRAVVHRVVHTALVGNGRQASTPTRR